MLEPVRRIKSLGADQDTGEFPGPVGQQMSQELKGLLLELPTVLGLTSKKLVFTPWATQVSAGEWSTPKDPPAHNLALYPFTEAQYREKLFGELPPYMILVSRGLLTDSTVDEALAKTKYKRVGPAVAIYEQQVASNPIPPAVFFWWIGLRDMTETPAGKAMSLAELETALGGEDEAQVMFAVSEPYTEKRPYPSMDFSAAQNSSLTDVSDQDLYMFTEPTAAPPAKGNILIPLAVAAAAALVTFHVGKAMVRR
jgi:hypothetical protein